MRRLFFYLIILKKALLLSIYPIFKRRGKLALFVRKEIENYIIFQPSKLRAKRVKRKLLKEIKPQRFITPDGTRLYSWFIKPKNDMPVILYLHGQAESILTHQDIAYYCLREGFGLFLLSYRGHYKSGGIPSEKGLYIDANTAIAHLKKLGIDGDKIIAWGHSLGSVIALETAINNKIMGVILQSPIKEIKSAAADVSNFYYKRLKLDFLANFSKKYIETIDFLQKMDNLNKIKQIQCPVLIMHSKTDRIAPYQNAIDLAELNPNSQLYISETGTHWDAYWCLDRVFEFVKSLEYNEPVQSNSQQ